MTHFLCLLWIFNLLIPDQIYTRVSQTVTSFCYIWKTTFKSNKISKQLGYFSVLAILKHSNTQLSAQYNYLDCTKAYKNNIFSV